MRPPAANVPGHTHATTKKNVEVKTRGSGLQLTLHFHFLTTIFSSEEDLVGSCSDWSVD